ncbi:MAG: acyl carrier protein [Acetobacteraceae bacterium]|nr:acyl carrier protein [Acetobacteraceae bacterium]
MGPRPEAVLIELTTLLRRLNACENLEISAETSLEVIPGLDSLRLLQAVAHLEEHFHVEIEVGALDDLHLVRDILNAVSSAQPESVPPR